nr:hypothetical protein [Limimaricola cinnabarinus]
MNRFSNLGKAEVEAVRSTKAEKGAIGLEVGLRNIVTIICMHQTIEPHRRHL